MIINDNTVWLEIIPGDYEKNIDKKKEITGKLVMPVIRANAYGHGLTEILRAAQQGGAAVCGLTARQPRICKDE